MPHKILIASQNKHKIAELTPILTVAGFEVVDARSFDLPEPEENGKTFIDNARIKAMAAMQATGLPVLADDSGLQIPEFNFMPGEHTRPFTEKYGGYENVRGILLDLAGKEEIAAQYYCCLVLLFPDGREIVAEGTMKGRLVRPDRGQNRFGYDPWFVPDGETRSYGEMSEEEKSRSSHRSLAAQSLLQQLKGIA